MRQISRLSVIAVSTALLITLSSCSSTQSTLEADDQPSTPTENRETVTSGQISDVPENNNASGESPQGSVTDAANFEIAENEDGTVTISRYIGTETDIVIPSQIGGKTVSAIGNVTGTTGAFEGCTSIRIDYTNKQKQQKFTVFEIVVSPYNLVVISQFDEVGNQINFSTY